MQVREGSSLLVGRCAGGSHGGSGAEVKGETRFHPAPPDGTTRLTLTWYGAHLEVELGGDDSGVGT